MKTLKATWISLMEQIRQNGNLITEDEPYLELLDQQIEFSSENAFKMLEDDRIRKDFQEMEKVFFSSQENIFGHSYHDCIISPRKAEGSITQNIAGLLLQKHFSRKAVLTFSPYGDNKVPCINCVHFLLRDNRLHISYFARGQDIYRKFPCDALCITRMGKMVSEALAVPLGTITANISSAHIYVQDLEKIYNIDKETETCIPKTILTSNRKKYLPLLDLLKSLNLELLYEDFDLPEIQSGDPKLVIAEKSRRAHELLGKPVWVDDSFLITDAYPFFPGPLTKYVFKTLGIEGLQTLFANKSRNAVMICLMGCYDGFQHHIVQGEARGYLDFSQEIADEKMPLSSIFIGPSYLQHRINALEKLSAYKRKLQADRN